MTKKYQLFVLVCLGVSTMSSLHGQELRPPFFIGINPGITVEPFYAKGEMDINIFPVVFQKSISKQADLRFTSILNLGLRNSGNAISHIGLEAALPVFLKAKESTAVPSKGFYIAGIGSFTRNRIARHSNIGLWAEPGYHLLFDNKLALSFGLQFGSTYFMYDDGNQKWGGHFGVKVIFGRWFYRPQKQ